jgi:NAD(P)H-hydrate epimerase
VVVDALLGTGLDRELGGAYFDAVAWINKLECPRIAVDIPSGLNADSGCRMGLAVAADLTITFIGLKRGLFTGDGPDCAGQVVFDDLQAPPAIYDSVATSGELIRENIIAELLSPRRRNTHKGHYGHVLIVGGGRGMSGAPRLAGEAALRSGAGLVSIATHPDHASHLNAGRPELMVHACQSAGHLDNLLERATVIALGPGLGTGEWASMLFGLCQAAGKPLIVDADGLNLMAALPESGRRSGAGQVLTPHPAEAARLLQTDTPSVQADRVHSAQELARRFEATVVLKGSGSVIAGVDGRYAICALGNPGMATAGSGDTLTGIIAAFMAQGLDAWRAACLGVVVHAAAGDLAAERLGQRSMLAGDITDHLHLLLR